MRILVSPAGVQISQSNMNMLRASGQAVDQIDDINDIFVLSRKQEYDLLIIYLGSPDHRTADLFRSLRRRGCVTPILGIVTGDLIQRVEALNAGADDCVPASVPQEELLARVRALLRRPPMTVGPVYRVGDLELNSSVATVTCEGERIVMPRREIALLELLMRAGLTPVTRERLEHALFSFDDAVTPNALEAAISRLRRRLKASQSIVTIMATRGFGYSLEEAPDSGTQAMRAPDRAQTSGRVASDVLVDG